MKGWILRDAGVITFDEVEKPVPRRGEVLVKIMAAGVCGSDIPRVFNKGGTYHYPLIPGHEMSGVVEDVGADVEKNIIGQTVAVFPCIPCGKCKYCRTGNYAQCENYGYLGSRNDGGFREYVAVPLWNIVPVNKFSCYEEMALIEPMSVALHALRRGKFEVMDNIVIFGAGPIGLLVGKWAQYAGANKVMIIDIDERKVQFSKKIGFKYSFNSLRGNVVKWIKEVSNGGADISVEASGSSVALNQAIQGAKKFSKVVLLGNPDGAMQIDKGNYSFILRKELTCIGCWNSYYSMHPKNEWHISAKIIEDDKFNVKELITHSEDFSQLGNLLKMIKEKEEFYCKVIIKNY